MLLLPCSKSKLLTSPEDDSGWGHSSIYIEGVYMYHIYHYADSTSDKIWAINTNSLANEKYEVFYGRRTNKLTRREVDIKNLRKKISEKERSGYERVTGRIDIQSDGIRYLDGPSVQPVTQPESAPDPIPSQKPKKRPKAIVDLSTINADNPSVFF